MNPLVVKVFDTVIAQNPDIQVGNDVHHIPRSNNICQRFFIQTPSVKRGIYVCLSEEYVDDMLETDEDVARSVSAINEKLSELRENAKHQTKPRMEEEDFILTSYP